MQDKNILYQASFLTALTLGDYDGCVTMADLKRHGDTGIGTFHRINGEMIVLDGTVYQARSDGTVIVPADDQTTPFANVTFFEGTLPFARSTPGTLADLRDDLTRVIAKQGANHFYIGTFSGSFPFVQVRAAKAQTPPYLPLAEAMVTAETIHTFRNQTGTVVALYCPSWVGGLNAPGWHLHFLSDDRTQGGHVLDLTLEHAAGSLGRSREFRMILPNTDRFQSLKLDADMSSVIHSLETSD